MPIYEYYCPVCHGRYRHFARKINEPAPPCPRCGNTEVRRLISAANLVHGDSYHEQQLKQGADQVRDKDMQTIAQFLQQSGRLTDAEGVYGSDVYRELLHRRAQGADDDELEDLVDDLVAEMQGTEAANMAAAVAMSSRNDDLEHEHHHAHDPHTADDLGWA